MVTRPKEFCTKRNAGADNGADRVTLLYPIDRTLGEDDVMYINATASQVTQKRFI
jgi:hypothetical protein